MFDLIVTGLPTLDAFDRINLIELANKKYWLTFCQPSGQARTAACSCLSPANSCGKDEYTLLVQLEHEMLTLNLFVIVNKKTGEGRIKMCRPGSETIDPWPFLAPQQTNCDDADLLVKLSTKIDSSTLKTPEFMLNERKNLTRAMNCLWNQFGWCKQYTQEAPYLWQVCEHTPNELIGMRIKNFGVTSLAVFQRFLTANGLSLGMDLTRFRDRLPKLPPSD